MKLVLKIAHCRNGVYDQTRPYTVIGGYNPANEYVRASAWDKVGVKLLERIDALLQSDEDIAARRIMIDCDGYWSTRTKKYEDRAPTVEHTFIIKAFTILNGPSLEVARMRHDAGVALAEAEKNRKGEDLWSAYRLLEGYVASIARCPVPSQIVNGAAEEVEHAPEETAPDGPEEAALRRFREADAARGVGTLEAADQSVAAVNTDVTPGEGVGEPEVLTNANAAAESSEAPADASSQADASEQLDTAAGDTASMDEADDQTFGNEDGEPDTSVEASIEASVSTDEPKAPAPAERPLAARRPPPPRRLPAASPAPGM